MPAYFLHANAETSEAMLRRAKLLAAEVPGLGDDDRDFTEVEPGQPSADAIRAIVNAIRFRPASGEAKVLLVQWPERLTLGTRNALSYTLESAAPAYLHTIVVTTTPPSRCW